MLSIHSFSSRFLVIAHGVATIAMIAIGLLAASLASAQTDSKVTLSSTKAVEITYVANEGFLISGAGRKVLIDALFSEGFGRFYTPAGEILTQETTAAPPFDHIDALLITHYHPDHIDPAAVVQHLSNDPRAVLIGPSQVNDLLKPIHGYKAIAKQVLVVAPGPGATVELSVRDLRIKSVALQHMSDDKRTTQNLGFIFYIGGLKVLHVGDAGMRDVDEYERLNLAKENIDIAFMHDFFFESDNLEAGRRMIGYIKPKAIVLMHMDVGKADYYRNLIGKMNDLPPVYMAAAPRETLRFCLADGKLSADGIPLQSQANAVTAQGP
jgi:L-ascorbate metabolism protein UlaG (beta-lactamase superfamily)